jgi:hypothetical protein
MLRPNGRLLVIAVGILSVLWCGSLFADPVDVTFDGFDQYIKNPTTCPPGDDCLRGISDTTDQYGVHMSTVFHGPDGNGPVQPGSPFGFSINGSPNAFGQLGPDFSGIQFQLPRPVSYVSIDASQYDSGDADFFGLSFYVIDKNGNTIPATTTSTAGSLLPGYGEKVLTFSTNTNSIAALVDDDGHQYGIYFDNLDFGYSSPDLVPTETPEPGSFSLLALCAGGLFFVAKRRVRHAA